MSNAITWVDNEAALERAVDACGQVVGLDTEFQRTSTFFPIPGLYQMASDGQVWLIDPLAIEDFSAFVDLLEDPRTVKVMHACTEDLELLRHHLGAVPKGLFDTQFAHAFVSDRFSVSHNDLVEQVVGEALPSSQTRSNWLRRPLSEGQIRYAANDVLHLAALHEHLRGKLESAARLHWFDEDMAERGAYQPPDPDVYYRGVGRAWSLDADALARLQALCAWRETTAMHRDLPRRRVVLDEHLVDLARRSQLNEHSVASIVPPPVAKRYGRDLVAAHAAAPAQVAAVPKPLTQSESKTIKQLRAAGLAVAEQLGMAQELLARKRDLEALYRYFQEHQRLDRQHTGWREPLVGEAFLNILQARS